MSTTMIMMIVTTAIKDGRMSVLQGPLLQKEMGVGRVFDLRENSRRMKDETGPQDLKTGARVEER